MAYIDIYGNEVSLGGSADVNAPSYQLKLAKADIDRWKGKTLLAIGDSITELNTKNDYKSWASYFNIWMSMTVINDGRSGTGLLKEYQGMKSFCNRVDLDPNGIYATADPDLVLIMGNGNDASGGDYRDYDGNQVTMPIPSGGAATAMPVGEKTDTSSALTCYGATRHILEALITRYPTAQIGWILSTPRYQDVSVRWGSSLGQMHGVGSPMELYAEAIKYVCADLNIPCLDLYHNSVLRPWEEDNATAYFADTLAQSGFVVHPNTAGIKAGMVTQIIEWVNANF